MPTPWFPSVFDAWTETLPRPDSGDRGDADAPGAIPRGSAGAGTVAGVFRKDGSSPRALSLSGPRQICYSIAAYGGSRTRRLAALHHAVQDVVDPPQRLGRQLHPRGRRVVLDLLGPGGPDDGAADVGMPQNPGEGELGHGESRLRGDGPQAIHRGEDLFVHEPLHEAAGLGIRGAGPLLRRLARAVLAGEDALGERGEDDLAHALALGERYHRVLYPALEHVVARLVGDDPVEVHLLRDTQRVGYLVRRPLGDAHIEHLALPDEVVERPHGLLERRLLVVAVALVEVHVFHPETPERRVALLRDVLAREAPVVRPLPHRKVDLRGEKVGVAVETFQGVADDLLCRAPHVHVRGVEEVDAEVVCPVDTIRRLTLCDAAAVGEPAPEGDLADLHPATAQPPVLHKPALLPGQSPMVHATTPPLPRPVGLHPREGVLEGVGAYLDDAVEGIV